jgi:hypothetical protein
MVEAIQKRQRISKCKAFWQIQNETNAIIRDINEEIMQKRESEFYRP